MTYVVTESCIKCKYTDCVTVCPVDCFVEGPNFLAIDPEACIDCMLCVMDGPVEAICTEEEVPENQLDFIRINAEAARVAAHHAEEACARGRRRVGQGQGQTRLTGVRMTGKVYLIGAGPGAADLITVRGAEILKRADIVFYDALVHPDMRALAPQAKQVAVGKRCSRISTDQRFINRNLVEAAAKYAIVVRLKGGDPMLFGRAQEEIEALASAGVAFEVVPGVTSALAASAEIGVSLTRRGVSRSVTFATPRVGEGEDTSDWAPSVASADTAVLYMAAGQAAEIARVLEASGMSPATPVMIVENASLPDARQIGTTLRGLRESTDPQIHGPALLFFGEVYRERAQVLMAATLVEDETADGLPQRRASPR